jgi:pyruvate,water dikinase
MKPFHVQSLDGPCGVMFTLDTESGFDDVVFITSAYGLGETVVQGSVNPDEFYVHKPTLKSGKPSILSRSLGSKSIKMVYAEKDSGSLVNTTEVNSDDRIRFSLNDSQIEELAHYAIKIESHYGRPMDIEWALDGVDGQIYIVQARPETVKSRQSSQKIERYKLLETSKTIVEGRAIGQKIGTGKTKIINDLSEMDSVHEGDVLVTDMTDPDWEPVMKLASAIITNRGGRTCHAAIIARELGVPAIVGTGNATELLKNSEEVTASCAEGDTGKVYEGKLNFEHTFSEVSNLPDIPVKIMMNVGNPSRAFDFASIPNTGVGLARLEFIINNTIGIHPKALIKKRTSCYKSPVDFYVQKLTEGISTIAASFSKSPVIIRMSDFKSNEYSNLFAGELYEPNEENPMIGWRGASRYYSSEYSKAFQLECKALAYARDKMKMDNIVVMIPFCRTPEECEKVIDIMGKNGLKRGENGLKVYLMCEIPSNVIEADRFAPYIDGVSIISITFSHSSGVLQNGIITTMLSIFILSRA